MVFGFSHGGLVCSTIFLVLLSISSLQVTGSASPQASNNGFSMKLIPKFSKHSPMYPGNLTAEQTYGLILQLSHTRAARLSSMSKNATMHTDLVSPKMEQVLDSYYLIEARIGSHRQELLLHLDTGSESTWVQCAHCSTCFELQGPPYEYYRSNTFHPIHCTAPRCSSQECDQDNNCIYIEAYGIVEAYSTVGILSTDQFSFLSADTGRDETINLVFGCGLVNNVGMGRNTGPNNRVAGMIGLSRGENSLLTQLGDQAQMRFSYCLPPWTARETPSYLRFGAHAAFPSGMRYDSIPILQIPDRVPYYLDLASINVNGASIGIASSTFAYDPVTRTGGTVIDTGTPLTYIPVAAHFALTAVVESYFRSKGYRLVRYDPVGDPNFTGMGSCFRKPTRDFNDFPTISFVFQGGVQFTPNTDAAFGIFDTFFCLQIRPPLGDNMTILGAFIQTGYIFVHDVAHNQLHFARADCTHAN